MQMDKWLNPTDVQGWDNRKINELSSLVHSK